MTEIRVATHRDIENIVELVEKFWEEHPHSEYGGFDATDTRLDPAGSGRLRLDCWVYCVYSSENPMG